MWPRDGGRIDQRSRLHKQVLTKPISLDFALQGDPSGILDDCEEGLRNSKVCLRGLGDEGTWPKSGLDLGKLRPQMSGICLRETRLEAACWPSWVFGARGCSSGEKEGRLGSETQGGSEISPRTGLRMEVTSTHYNSHVYTHGHTLQFICICTHICLSMNTQSTYTYPTHIHSQHMDAHRSTQAMN